MYYLYGFASASFVYWALSRCFPAEETLIPACIYDDVEIVNGVEYQNDGVHTPQQLTKLDNSGPPKEANTEVGQV